MASGVAHVEHEAANAVAGLEHLARNLLGLRHERLGAIDLHDQRRTFLAHNGARHDFALLLREFFHQRVPLIFAELLNHHLLCGLRRNAAETLDRDHLAIHNLALFIHDVSPDRDLACEAVHLAAEFFGVERVEVLACSTDHRHLKIAEEMLAVDVPVACDRVEDAKSFSVHGEVTFETFL